MSCISKNARCAALAVVCATVVALLVFRAAQIVGNPTHDFDTSAILLGIGGGFHDNVGGHFCDTAHPGLLSLGVLAGSAIIGATCGSPMQYWAPLLVVAMASACLALYAFLRRLGVSRLMALVGCLLYLASPVISDIAGRAEENLLLHGFLICAISALHRYLRDGSATSLVLIAGSAVLLIAQHLQPYLVVCGGLSLYAASEFLRSRQDREPDGLRRATKALLAFVVSGGGYFLLFEHAFDRPFVNYAAQYLSVFNNDSSERYVRAFLLFAQGYTLTGSAPFEWTSVGVNPTSQIYLLGVVVVASVILLVRRRHPVDFVMLAGLGFAMLYEPLSSERWDTFVIPAIISIVSRTADPRDRGFASRWCVPEFACCIVAALNLGAIAAAWEGLQAASASKADRATQLGVQVVYSDLQNAIPLVGLLPNDVRIRNIADASLRAGDVVYAKDLAVFGAKVQAVCIPTTIPSFWLVSKSW